MSWVARPIGSRAMAMGGDRDAMDGDRPYGPIALKDPVWCGKQITVARALQPADPALEAAGDAYLAVLTELQPLTVKLRAYFDQGNYKDDRLALAIELHPRLMASRDRSRRS